MESDRNLWELPYYHGLLPREDTVAMLKANGEFLIRKSEENAGDARTFVLSVVYGNVKHYLFREEKGRISIDFKSDKGYKSIRDFVDSHLQSRQPVCSASHVIITRPIGRKDWELAHADIVNGAKLGAGAFGIVRRGELKQTGGTVKVAIKEATLTKCTKEQIKEFMNEARIMRKFKHPNVIQSYGELQDIAVGQEPLMIVMELATNGALKDYLQEIQRSPRSKLYMCLGAASGLAHVHENNVVHCDIAARNCLYSEQKVKIADFGLARELTPGDTEIKLDKDQKLPIKWLAPETMRDRVCTKKSDVWAFGILCWEIFANGENPYQNFGTNNEVARRVIMGERMKFSGEAPAEFCDYMTKQVWAGDADDRSPMQQVLLWFDNNIKRMTDSQRSRMDNTRGGGSSKPSRPTSKDGTTAKEKSGRDKNESGRDKSQKGNKKGHRK
uniref:Tyrosine-protein kinase n=1 Tax=Meloidogyne incognita TaxID=6306 RepID=A0A914MMN0_MELIC